MGMRRRMLSILTCLALCLTLLPVTAAAAGLTELYVGGTQVSLDGTGTTSGEGWSYDAGTNTLTLNGANITTGHDDAGIYADGDLTIHLEGENTVALPSQTGGSAGIVAIGSLTIQGGGTLTAKGTLYGIAGESVAITDSTVHAEGGTTGIAAVVTSGSASVAIGGSAQVYAKGGKIGIAAGADNDASVEISGSAQVYAEGDSAGIVATSSNNDASVSVGGSAQVYAEGGTAGIAAGADNDASVSVGDSAQVYAEGGSAGIAAGAESGSASVEITGGDVTLSAPGDNGNAIHMPGTGSNHLLLTGGNTVIAPGTTLDLRNVGADDIDFGTLTNNGTLVLSASTDIEKLGLGGTGLVQMDGDNYSNNGTKLTTVNPIVVSTNAADKDHWTLPSDSAKCTWAQDTDGVWTLTLDGVYVRKNITIDTNNQAAQIVINVLGDSVVDGTAELEQNSLTAGTAGAVTRYGLTGGAVETYADPIDVPGILVNNADLCTLALTGEPLAVLDGGILLDGDGATLEIAQDAEVSACGVFVGGDNTGGAVRVLGTLASALPMTGDSGALTAGQVEIGAGGHLRATGPVGLYLGGVADGSGQTSFTNALVLQTKGRLTASGMIAAVVIGGTGTWPADPAQVIVGLPDSVQAKSFTSNNKGVCSITNPGDSLSYSADGLPGALKLVDITGAETTPEPIPDPEPQRPVLPDDDEEETDPTYSVILPGKIDGGQLSVKKRYAEEGETFRFTVVPDAGWELASLSVTDGAGREIRVTDEGGGAYSFTMPASRVTVDVSFRRGGGDALPFADVAEDYWAASEIRWAFESGYMTGVSADAFHPGGTVTRQQVWMILARMSGADPADMAAARAWAVENGVSDGTNPGGAVTRQQLAAMLYRFAQAGGHGFTGAWAFRLDFPDAGEVGEYAYEAMCWMTMNSVIGGTTDGTLDPNGPATRAQLAVMLWRFYQIIG